MVRPVDPWSSVETVCSALVRALERHRWRRGDAATALGMSRTKLWRRMKELGLDP